MADINFLVSYTGRLCFVCLLCVKSSHCVLVGNIRVLRPSKGVNQDDQVRCVKGNDGVVVILL